MKTETTSGWRFAADPRLYQIGVLALLLLVGVVGLDFEIGVSRIVLLVTTAIVVQYVLTRARRLPRFDPKSALISSLSLSLLLRTGSPLVAVAAMTATIASKFVLRARGKHVFNPTNFGLVFAMLLTRDAWVSPGQWGSAAFLAFLFACMGGIVVNRAARSDVTWAFLIFWVAMLLGRSLWLGEPVSIPLHRLQSGSFLLFTFFMISDPKTTPDSRAGRILFALLVASGAWWIQFHLFRTNGLIWSLAAFAMSVPLIDVLLPGRKYEWSGTPGNRGRAPSFRIPAEASPRATVPIAVAGPATLLAQAARRTPRAGHQSDGTRAPMPSAQRSSSVRHRKENHVRTKLVLPVLVFFLVLFPQTARAFCGFYVAKADTKLFNRASQVVLVREGDRTVLTMTNDFRGEPTEFAVVVPVPTFIARGQIHVADKALIDHLDAYSSPRLVEYFDPDPCMLKKAQELGALGYVARSDVAMDEVRERARSLGVTIEASYTVGEYDILILSAKQSTGLETWLVENGYRIPRGASSVLGSYLRQGMRFFVAKVNLEEQARLGFSYLRPIQVAYESPKFMLPIRLGMVNADGPQELFVYALTPNGRVETTNYRTVKLPAEVEVPLFVKDGFSDFYKDLFAEQVRRESGEAVFLEYAWNMSWCDPCAADPLSRDELRELGVFWLDRDLSGAAGATGNTRGGTAFSGGKIPFASSSVIAPAPQQVFISRLHVRYDAAHFPEDLVFQETGDTSNFQGRYILRHPWTGNGDCPERARYRRELRERHEQQARTLASLTGWDIGEIRDRMRSTGQILAAGGPADGARESWWQKLWGN